MSKRKMLPIVSLELGQATDLDNLSNLDKPKATCFPSLINCANHADPEATHLIMFSYVQKSLFQLHLIPIDSSK